jgi:hypothetical protein
LGKTPGGFYALGRNNLLLVLPREREVALIGDLAEEGDSDKC